MRIPEGSAEVIQKTRILDDIKTMLIQNFNIDYFHNLQALELSQIYNYAPNKTSATCLCVELIISTRITK